MHLLPSAIAQKIANEARYGRRIFCLCFSTCLLCLHRCQATAKRRVSWPDCFIGREREGDRGGETRHPLLRAESSPFCLFLLCHVSAPIWFAPSYKRGSGSTQNGIPPSTYVEVCNNKGAAATTTTSELQQHQRKESNTTKPTRILVPSLNLRKKD